MGTDLQTIVDGLGAVLNRSVAIDNLESELQAYSPHYGPVDDVRLQSILQRKVSGPAVDWSAQFLTDALEPVRIPSNPTFGYLARLAVPVVHQGLQLGVVWVIEDTDEPLDDAQVQLVVESARDAGTTMYLERFVSDETRSRSRRLMKQLLFGEHSASESAVGEILSDSLFPAGPASVVIAIRPMAIEDARIARDAIEVALMAARRSAMGNRALHLTSSDQGLLLLAIADPRRSRDEVHRAVTTLREAFRSGLGGGGGAEASLTVGVGEVIDSIRYASLSCSQAMDAVQIAAVAANHETLWWSDLGVYRTLVRLPLAELGESSVPLELRKMLESRKGRDLTRTLEVYLDNAGDAQAAAAQLSIHRTTLYYRLGKIEELTQLSLANGEHRLVLHLGLKIARLVGLTTRDPDAVTGTSPGSESLEERAAASPRR